VSISGRPLLETGQSVMLLNSQRGSLQL